MSSSSGSIGLKTSALSAVLSTNKTSPISEPRGTKGPQCSNAMQKLEAKENKICMDIDKDLESLRELVKKVKTEGVKEVIERISNFFNALIVNKREQKTARALISDLDEKIKDS